MLILVKSFPISLKFKWKVITFSITNPPKILCLASREVHQPHFALFFSFNILHFWSGLPFSIFLRPTPLAKGYLSKMFIKILTIWQFIPAVSFLRIWPLCNCLWLNLAFLNLATLLLLLAARSCLFSAHPSVRLLLVFLCSN